MKKTASILAICLGIVLTGCMEEILPTEYVTAEQVAASESALDAMVASIYTTLAGYVNKDGNIEMCSYGSNLAQMEHTTTALACTGSGGYNTCAAWTQGSNPGSTSNRGKYPSYIYYAYIKTVNDIIGLIDDDTTDETAKHYLGMAYAYRALFYMEFSAVMEYITPTDTRYSYTTPENPIANLTVPIVTDKTPSDQVSNNPRATFDDVYDLVLSDLGQAETLLSDFTRTDKVQPDLGVVYGLFARAYQNMASHTDISERYTDTSNYWQQAATYAQKAIDTSGCTPLTEDQWLDPKNGFNNRNSQNSWMLATSISESNTEASSTGSFVHAMLFGTETTFSVYGWRVGRSLDRAMYERLADTDWRKNSWLAPNFFYESKNQKEGGEYLIERDASGKLINNKWALAGNNDSDDQGNWSDDYSGWGPDNTQYQLNSSPSWIRSRIRNGQGFVSWPWLYVNIKFRPHLGNYTNYEIGGATDFPMMRVEEMYFIKAEAQAHTSLSSAVSTLEEIVKTRNSQYSCKATGSLQDFMEELMFQKNIEFWGEGRNYFDQKRLKLGRHSAYPGTAVSRYQYAFDMNGVFPGMTPGWNDAERNANPAVFHYNNPYTNPTGLYYYSSNSDISNHYGDPIDLTNHTFFNTEYIK